MTATLLISNLLYLLSILISSGAHGVKIQFYRHRNFTGLGRESHSIKDCSNIPRNKRTYFHSIRTDTCFVAYSLPNCEARESQKYMPGDIVLSSGELIDSFQVCNENEGGSQLNLDINYYGYRANDASDVLESYKKVCSCVNVPQHVQSMIYWSINNHHNALLAYYEPDCSENKWNSTFIPAGEHFYPTYVHLYNKKGSGTGPTVKIQSFGPDPNSSYFQTSCNSSHVTSTESTNTLGSSTKSEMNVDADMNKRFVVRTNCFFAKLTQTVAELKQGFLDFTAKIKSHLHDLLA